MDLKLPRAKSHCTSAALAQRWLKRKSCWESSGEGFSVGFLKGKLHCTEMCNGNVALECPVLYKC